MMRFVWPIAFLTGLIAAPLPVGSLAANETPETKSVDQAAIVNEIREIIGEYYVLPEKRPALDAVLKEGLESGRYDVASPQDLARLVNEDLVRVGKDRHLSFRYDPEGAKLAEAADGSGDFDEEAYLTSIRRGNHGISELKVLPGNVRYMSYTGFNWIGDDSAAALDNAMRFLSGGDAIIIDLRRNGGGSPAAVRYITSHFMEADQPLVTFYMGGEPDPDVSKSLADMPAGRLDNRPLYVLTSGRTASAAEEFAGHVGGFKLGELVGETTAGAGFRNEVGALADDYMLSVSVGRAVLASTGKDWEAVGIAPTLPIDASDALSAAHAAALGKIAESRSEDERAAIVTLADAIQAMTETRTTELALAAYAGKFGERAVMLQDGKLYYHFGRRPREELVTISANRFVMRSRPQLRIDFEIADGSVAAIEVGALAGPTQGRYPLSE